jgi:hypothetical protein
VEKRGLFCLLQFDLGLSCGFVREANDFWSQRGVRQVAAAGEAVFF